jgi:hypothetical protein
VRNDWQQPSFNSGVWDECAKYIKRQMPGIIELKKFFEPYEISDDRVFEKWELQEIFPFITERDLSDITHGYAQQGK